MSVSLRCSVRASYGGFDEVSIPRMVACAGLVSGVLDNRELTHYHLYFALAKLGLYHLADETAAALLVCFIFG
jgi:hypothetical protein